jgi:hypothetical protein
VVISYERFGTNYLSQILGVGKNKKIRIYQYPLRNSAVLIFFEEELWDQALKYFCLEHTRKSINSVSSSAEIFSIRGAEKLFFGKPYDTPR